MLYKTKKGSFSISSEIPFFLFIICSTIRFFLPVVVLLCCIPNKDFLQKSSYQKYIDSYLKLTIELSSAFSVAAATAS